MCHDTIQSDADGLKHAFEHCQVDEAVLLAACCPCRKVLRDNPGMLMSEPAAAVPAKNQASHTCCHAEAEQAKRCWIGEPGPSGNGGSWGILKTLFCHPQPLIVYGNHVVCALGHVGDLVCLRLGSVV
jgi:hypothetical protein